MRGFTRGSSLIAAVCAVAATASADAQGQGTVRQVFASTELTVEAAQISPNGKWLAITHANRDGGNSLWMAPVGGGAPFRLTAEGADDDNPAWFASGDRIAFPSSRPNRNGGHAWYLVQLSIDPASGHAVGAPRQVSSEPIAMGGQPSPDGRWLPYVSEDRKRIMIVPANGGTAKELARPEGQAGGLFFGPDSKHLYFLDIIGATTNRRIVAKRVPVEGGPLEVLLSADHEIRILRADPRYVLHRTSTLPLRYEVRTLGGQLAGAISLPEGVGSGARNSMFTGDGWGVMAYHTDWVSTVRVQSVDGGEPRTLVDGGRHWPEAWSPDGSAVIMDRTAGDRVFIQSHALAGGTTKEIALPVGTVQSGWQSSVGPWFSARVRPDAAGGKPNVVQTASGRHIEVDVVKAINVQTGASRDVSAGALRLPIRGRGGYEQAGDRWILAEPTTGGQAQVRLVDPASGASEVVFTAPIDTLASFAGALSVHGTRLAFMKSRGDSLDLYLRDSPAQPQRRVASFSRDGDTQTWSWGGSRIAVADWLPGSPRHGGLHLYTLNGTGAPTVRRYDLGADNGCDSFMWTPDDSHIVMLCYGNTGRIMKLRLSDGQFTPVLTGDLPQQIWEYYLSPDGKRVTYPIQRDMGSAVYVGDVKALVQSRRGQ